MNDIFKLFKKRAQAGKSTNIQDVIKDLNEKEQTEIMSENKFDRTNKSYLSISKSGRLKSKKSQNSRALQDDLFAPATAVSIDISSSHVSSANSNLKSTYESRLSSNKPIYDQNSDNADSRTSSTSSSFRSSYDDVPVQNLRLPTRLTTQQGYYPTNAGLASNYNHSNSNNYNKNISPSNNNIFKRFY